MVWAQKLTITMQQYWGHGKVQTDLRGCFSGRGGLGLRVCYACQPHQVALQEGLQLCCFCCSALVEKLQSAFYEGLIVLKILQIQARIRLLGLSALQV